MSFISQQSNKGKHSPPEVRVNLDSDYLQVIEFSRFESIPPWAFSTNIPITYGDPGQKGYEKTVPKKVFEYFKNHPNADHMVYNGRPYDFLNLLLKFINENHENDIQRVWERMKLDGNRNKYDCFIANRRVRETILNFIEPELKRIEGMAGQEIAAQNLFSDAFKEYWKNNISYLSHGYNYDLEFYPIMKQDFLEYLAGSLGEDELVVPNGCRAKMLVVATYVSYNVHLGVLIYRPIQKLALTKNETAAFPLQDIQALE